LIPSAQAGTARADALPSDAGGATPSTSALEEALP
jgi:hypothetical protein